MFKRNIIEKLNKLYNESPSIDISSKDKFVIFSDTHLGNGSYQDDFKQNSELFLTILKEYYLPKGYTLILNGDIEELYKFNFNQIYNYWGNVYEVFEEFRNQKRLMKIFGNHDFILSHNRTKNHKFDLYESVNLKYHNHDLFIYHGHQTSGFLEDYNRFSCWVVRYVANPFGYKNKTFHYDDKSKFKNETYAYNFSSQNKLISLMGHTHRPLFESYSKFDSLKFEIESFLNDLNKKNGINRKYILNTVKKLKLELDNLDAKKYTSESKSTIYNDNLLVPCLFNSGSVIGKRGATGLEIKNGKISLIYWFDSKRSNRYLNYDGIKSKQLNESDYYKAIIKKDSLENIFLRINLLA